MMRIEYALACISPPPARYYEQGPLQPHPIHFCYGQSLSRSSIDKGVANLIEQSPALIRTDLEKLSSRNGQFEGFNVFGIQLRAPDGIVSWKINMWNGDGHADYWVTGSEYRLVGTHMLDPRANGGTTYNIGPVTDVSETEHKAVETALKFWRENPPTSRSSIGD